MNSIKVFCREHYYLLSGLLMFLSFPSFDFILLKGFPFFAWIFMVPLFMYVKDKPFKDVYLSSFLAGLLGNFLTYQWIGNFAGQGGGYPLIVIFMTLVLSVFFAAKIFLAELISKLWPGFRFLIYPIIWCLFDWIQSVGYLAFPWMNIAHSQYPAVFVIQITSIIGVVGLNFLMIITAYTIAEALNLYSSKITEIKSYLRDVIFIRAASCVAIVLFVIIYGLVVVQTAGVAEKKDMRIGIAQSCIDPWKGWDQFALRYLKELQTYTDRIVDDSLDLLVWSESATLETISFRYKKGSPSFFDKELLNYVKSIGTPLLTGEIGLVPNNRPERRYNFWAQNNAALINANGEVVDTYSKINLVPFGEWFPYAGVPLVGEAIDNLAASMGGSSFLPGDGPKLMHINGKAFAPLICYEGIFYRLCRKYKQMGADFFINITNDGWSDDFSGHMQHFSAAVFRAVENGIWVVRAGNDGFSAFIDPYGRITASMPMLQKGSFYGDIDFSLNHTTFYSNYGGYIQGVLVFAAFILFAARLFFFIRKRLLKRI